MTTDERERALEIIGAQTKRVSMIKTAEDADEYREEKDKLLIDLLVVPYRTLAAQNA